MKMTHTLCIALVTVAGCFANRGSAHAVAAPPYDSCIAGPYVLTFAPGSAQLTKRQKAVLATIRLEAKHCEGEMLIESYPSDDGPPNLQRRRSSVVYDYLKNSGVPTGNITIGLQAQPWPTPTEDGRPRHVQVFMVLWR